MPTSEQWSIIIAATSAGATFLAVLVALFGEKFRQLWSRPKLDLNLAQAAFTTRNDGKRGWYFLLEVSNRRRSNPAPNVRIILTRMEHKTPDGEWAEREFSGPVQVLWRWPDRMPVYATVGPPERATFACLHEGEDFIMLRLYWYPNNLQPRIFANRPIRLTFRADSDVAHSKDIQLVVRWNGNWSSSRAEMEKNLQLTASHA